ncbi:MAG: type IV pilus assembly protein PilM [Chthonomonas sp.]|nr:type IV pilus assembly protein PilM [Chthonomonas sp.]
MAKKLTSVLGIDIGSQQIKIAEIKMQGREPAVTALGIARTPEGAVDHTGVYDVDNVAQVVKDLAQASGASVNQVVVTVAGQASVLVRTVEAPRLEGTELKNHMEWEITRNVPFAETTIQSDFKPIPGGDPASQNMDVIMAISPQSAIDTLVDIVKKSGKNLAVIDVEPLGLARAFKATYGADYDNQTVCVVDFGHKTTAINIYRDGYLMLPRQVPMGGENFTQAIAANMGVGMDEAEHMKTTRARVPENAGQQNAFGQTGGFEPFNPFADAAAFNPGLTINVPAADPGPGAAGTGGSLYDYAAPTPGADDTPADFNAYAAADATPEPEPEPAMAPVPAAPPQNDEETQLYQAFAQVLDEFVSELRRSVDYYRSKGGEVSAVLLVGGASKLPGLTEHLQASLGIPTSLLDPSRGLPINAKRLEAGLLENNRQDFAIAIGNGLHIAFD